MPDPDSVSELDANTTPDRTDLLHIIDDVSGTPTDKKITVSDITPYANIKHFGAIGDAVANDTVAIQAALDANAAVYIPEGTYNCVGLTMDNGNNRVLRGDGPSSLLFRQANGDVLTLSDNNCQLSDFKVSSDGTMTGDNIVLVNTENSWLENVVSQSSVGRTLKATGTYNGLKVIGGRYNLSVSAAVDAPPIVLGDSTNTSDSLYANLQGFNFNENDAPLIMHRAEACFISDCQIGGLQLLDGNGVESSGIMVRGCRITGDMQIDGSNQTIIGNLVSSTIDVTFGVTANLCIFIGNSTPNSVTNNGNDNNLILLQGSTGGLITWTFGDSTSNAVLTATQSSPGRFRLSALELPNNTSFALRNAADDADGATSAVNVSNRWNQNNLTTDASTVHTVTGINSFERFDVNGGNKLKLDATAVATETALLLWDVDNATLERVTVGAADSGGMNFKVLRIPN